MGAAPDTVTHAPLINVFWLNKQGKIARWVVTFPKGMEEGGRWRFQVGDCQSGDRIADLTVRTRSDLVRVQFGRFGESSVATRASR